MMKKELIEEEFLFDLKGGDMKGNKNNIDSLVFQKIMHHIA